MSRADSDLTTSLVRLGGDAHVLERHLLRNFRKYAPRGDELADDDFLVFVEPPSFDERIVNQYALFSLASSPTLSPDEWLARHPDLARRIVVPAELKWEIRDKLDQANITERVLFPGLDGLSRWLKRYYSPRQAASSQRRKREACDEKDSRRA